MSSDKPMGPIESFLKTVSDDVANEAIKKLRKIISDQGDLFYDFRKQYDAATEILDKVRQTIRDSAMNTEVIGSLASVSDAVQAIDAAWSKHCDKLCKDLTEAKAALESQKAEIERLKAKIVEQNREWNDLVERNNQREKESVDVIFHGIPPRNDIAWLHGWTMRAIAAAGYAHRSEYDDLSSRMKVINAWLNGCQS